MTMNRGIGKLCMEVYHSSLFFIVAAYEEILFEAIHVDARVYKKKFSMIFAGFANLLKKVVKMFKFKF